MPLRMNELVTRHENESLGLHHWPQAVTFPFRSEPGLRRLWIAPLACLVPVLGLLVIKGWRLDIVRRRMRSDGPAVVEEDFPQPSDLGRFLADGLRLIVARGIYMLPLLVVLAVSFQHTIESVLEIGRWVVDQFSSEHRRQASIVMILLKAAFSIASKFVVPVIYYYMLKPFLYAGTIRFAQTGRFRSLINLPAQALMISRHLPGFMLLFFFNFTLALCINILSALAMGTVIGALIIPFVSIPLYNTGSGYLIGTLGRALSHGKTSP